MPGSFTAAANTGVYVPPIVPARDPKPEPKPEPEAEPRLGVKRGRKPKSQPLCSNCGQPGHRKPTCPNDKKGKEEDNPFDNDLADKIENLKDEGFSAEYIADDLRLPLETVKRYY
jgi:hypothetical protein